MSEMGQTRKFLRATGKSALPSTTGIVSQTLQVRKVPDSDMAAESHAMKKPPEGGS
jgi:hypothetical protein